MCAALCGLVVGPGWRLANSVVTVLPMITPLALRHSATQAASPNGTLPSKIGELWPVGMSCVSMMSFTPIGTPRSSPPVAWSAARACFSASAGSRCTHAFTTGSRSAMRSRQRLHQLLRGERARLDRLDGFGRADRLHRSAPCTQPAMSSRRASSCCRPTSWMPTGRPLGPRPNGRLTHGIQR